MEKLKKNELNHITCKYGNEKERKMNIGILLMIIIGGAAGALSTLYLVLAMPVVIVYKIYRKIRYGIRLYN